MTDEVLAELTRGDGRPVVLRGGMVLTLDRALGALPSGDVVIEAGRIAAVAPSGGAVPADAIVVDARGKLVMPGFVDGHRHCWQGSMRRLIPDADLPLYMSVTHDGIARHYRPEDMYIGDLVALLGALDSGFTTVTDLSHNSRSRAHSDAVFRAYRETGIRAVHASAPPNAGDWEEQWPEDLIRLKELADADPLITLRMAIDMRRVKPIEELMAIARRLGLAITIDGVMGAGSSAELASLGERGLLGPDVTIIHATSLTDAAWTQLIAAGAHIVLATTSDEQLGLAGAVPPVQRVMDAGILPGLSVDVEISLAGDPFTQMRATMLTQRMHATMEGMAGRTMLRRLESAEVLDWATLGGAAAAGLLDELGSLTPGKQADILIADVSDAVSIPAGNAVALAVHGIDRASIEAVFVGGRPRKWAGRLVGVDLEAVRVQAEASRAYLVEQAGFTLDIDGLHGVPALRDEYLRSYLGSHDDAM